MSYTPILRLPEAFITSPQMDQAINDAHAYLECATNDVSTLNMSTGDKLLSDVEQLRSFFFICTGMSAPRQLTLSHQADNLVEARRVISVYNEGPSDLTVKVNTNNTWADILTAGSSRIYYIKADEVFVLASYGIASGAPSLTYDVSLFVSGQPPVLTEIYRLPITQDLTFPANFTGSRASCRILPATPATFKVYKDSTQVGTCVFQTSGSHTFTTTSGAAVGFAPGTTLRIIPPNPQDASLADCAITLLGSKA